MDFALLSSDGFMFILRWLHFFFGIIWIGLLYYFNFVQGAFFNETDATTKSNAIQKLVPRALWWFRWAAMGTFLTGWIYIGMKTSVPGGATLLMTSWGVAILTGATLGSIMWANVWFVIWPNQKIVIESTTGAAQGKPANPAAAGAGARAAVASRTNTLFSIPMLFCMAAASHLNMNFGDAPNYTVLIALFIIIFGALEFNALKGKLFGPLNTPKGTIHLGFGLALIMYVLMEVLL